MDPGFSEGRLQTKCPPKKNQSRGSGVGGACTPRKPGKALDEMIVGSFMPLNQFISVLSYFNIHYVQYSFSVVSTRTKPLLDLLQR